MKKLLTLITILITFNVSAQVMPSPDASAMIKGVNSSVNLYNGVATIPIPLYEATANNGAKVPVSLLYQTGGIKVNEIASVAGLGWQLQAGGAITRVVRSQPDDHVQFATNINYDKMRDVAYNEERFDYEKDLFFYSYPGGGGKFIFSSDIFSDATKWIRCNESGYQACLDACGTSLNCFAGCDDSFERKQAYLCTSNWSSDKIVTLPSSDIKIQFYYEGENDNYFVITDLHGNRYFFGENSSSREKTTTNYKDNFGVESYKNDNKKEFISTWKLNRIEFANLPKNQTITFSYTSSTITTENVRRNVPIHEYNLYVECMKNISAGENCDECMDFNQKVDNPYDIFDDPLLYSKYNSHNKYMRNNIATFKSTIYTKFLSTINFPKGKIQFTYSSRGDLNNGKRLTTVSLYDHVNRLVSKTELDQGYFNSSDSYFKGEKRGYVGEKGKRLKLNGLIKDGFNVVSFDYINDKFYHSGTEIDMYELPPRDSYYTDHWGYYNGGPHQGETYTWHKNANVGSISIGGIKKYITKYAKANILTQINYLSGGYKKFEYGKHGSHGGVRVNRISQYSENDQLVSDVTYTYTGENPSPDLTYVENQVIIVQQDRNEVTGAIVPHLYESSKSFIFDLNGPSLGYEIVSEENEITGEKAIHQFISGNSRPIDYAKKYIAVVDTYQDEFGTREDASLSKFGFPFTSPNVMSFDRGVERMVTYRDKNNKKIREVENIFLHEAIENLDYSVTNRSFHLQHMDEDAGWFQDNSLEYKYVVSEYVINTRNLYLDKSITRSYDDNGILIAERTTSFDYSGSYQTLPVKVTTEKTAGGGLAYNSFKKTYYPFSITSAHSWYSGDRNLLSDLKDIHAIATPVAQLQEVDLPEDGKSWLTSGMSFTTFEEVNNMVLPKSSHSLVLDKPKDLNINTQGVFEKTSEVIYNDQGLLESKIGQDGITTSYSYDNAGYVKTVTTDPGVESLKRTTSYTYKPLVGVSSVTGPNGRKVTYTYDEQNRLLLTKDNEGNILKRYRYNYAGENNGLSAHLSTSSGYNKTCSRIGFTVSGAENSYGKSRYTWNFDDNGNTEECGSGGLEGPIGKPIVAVGSSNNESTFESGSNYASHVFTEPGDYTVTVRIFNPEVGKEKVVTRPITIYGDKANAKIFGPEVREHCSNSDGGGGQFEEEQIAGAQQQIGALDGDGSHNGDYPMAYFSVGFDSDGAKCQSSGYTIATLEYQDYHTGNWVSFGIDGAGSLPEDAFRYSSSPYTIEIKGEISDKCSSLTQTTYHTLTINPCNYNSGGGGTGGGSDDGDPIKPIDKGDETFQQVNGNGIDNQ